MKRSNEVLVGITATAAIILAVVGSLWLARGGLEPGYKLYAKFTWGAGLKQGQPVLLSGVNVGYVDGVDIRSDGLLIVRLRVRKVYKIPLGTTATIEPNGFFGDQLVALHPDKPNPETYTPGDTLLSGVATPSIGDVLMRVDTIAANVSVLTTSLRKSLVESNGLADVQRVLRSADVFMTELSKVAASQNAELTKTEASLRHAASAVDSASIDSTMRSIRQAAASVATLGAEVKTTTAALDTTLARFNNSNGSLSKLMNDPALYDQVKSMATRIDDLIADFKKNPRKYIKLSIF